MIRLSVVIPTYNMAHLLERCLNSIIRQDINDIEVIVVNDGSTDNVTEVFNRYKFDPYGKDRYPCLRIINQENQGLCGARNTGIRESSGFYWTTVDPDDTIPNGAFRKLLDAAIENGDPDWIMGSVEIFPDNGKPEKILLPDICLPGDEAKRFIYETYSERLWTTAWAKLFKLSLIKDNCIEFVPAMKKHEDTEFCYRFIRYISSFASIDSVVYNYILNGNSATAKFKGQSQLDAISIMNKTRSETVAMIYPPDKRREAMDKERIKQNNIYLALIYWMYCSQKSNKYRWLKRICKEAEKNDPRWLDSFKHGKSHIISKLFRFGYWMPHLVLYILLSFNKKAYQKFRL